MAGLSATGVLSSVADGANFDYTVKLTDTSSTTADRHVLVCVGAR